MKSEKIIYLASSFFLKIPLKLLYYVYENKYIKNKSSEFSPIYCGFQGVEHLTSTQTNYSFYSLLNEIIFWFWIILIEYHAISLYESLLLNVLPQTISYYLCEKILSVETRDSFLFNLPFISLFALSSLYPFCLLFICCHRFIISKVLY